MAKTRVQKLDELKMLKTDLESAQTVVFFKGPGLLFSEQEEIRRGARKNNGKVSVYKNTLVGIASKEILDQDVQLSGSIISAFDFSDSFGVLKDIHRRSKEKGSKLELIGGIYEGKFVNASYISQIATVPSKEESFSKMVYILNNPATGIARTLNEIARKLTATVAAVESKLQ